MFLPVLPVPFGLPADERAATLSGADESPKCDAEPSLKAETCACSQGLCFTPSRCKPSTLCKPGVLNELELATTELNGSAMQAKTQLLEAPERATILMSLVFNDSNGRSTYVGQWEADDQLNNRRMPRGYLRELRRIRFFIESARQANSTLPIHVMVGGERFERGKKVGWGPRSNTEHVIGWM